jgi:hypothetical protein
VNRDAVWISAVVFGIALLLGLAGFISYRSASNLVVHGERATGEVIAFSRSGGKWYTGRRPVFVFTAIDGRSYRVASDTYSTFDWFYVGDKVPVVYYAGAPATARIEDRTSLYGWPFGAGESPAC